jgi:cytochrome c oxidase subunit II
MRLNRRTLGFALIGAGAYLLIAPAIFRNGGRVLARTTTASAASGSTGGQEQAPNRREFTITARNYDFSPKRIEVTQDDLVKITLRSEDEAHSFSIDGYRIMKRVPAGGSTTFDFRADKPGTFAFYCSMTNAEGHRGMKGELVVTPR